jgi:hypothetical protein
VLDLLGIGADDPSLLRHAPLELQIAALSGLFDLEDLRQHLDGFGN